MKKLSRPIDKGQERGISLSYHLPDFWLPDENEKDKEASWHVEDSHGEEKNLEMRFKFNLQVCSPCTTYASLHTKGGGREGG